MLILLTCSLLRSTPCCSILAFLNGDWPFINALLGFKAPSATHPCPVCIISSSSFLRSARYRTPRDSHSIHPDQPALLTILPERIVPTPLHLFLGISNRIIFDAFSELLGKERRSSVEEHLYSALRWLRRQE